ncbi:MAG: hypothetical protein RLY16_2169, partial [Bacteroidota bacterium]
MQLLKKIFFLISLLASHKSFCQLQPKIDHLQFPAIPPAWDEALPMGNGMLGALIWEKDKKLRMSLDHAMLWDLRPMAQLHTEGFNFKMVKEKVLSNQYELIQQIGDHPYEREPAPSKLPGAALMFDIQKLGPVNAATLNTQTAETKISWLSGVTMQAFVHATQPIGYFKFTGLDHEL